MVAITVIFFKSILDYFDDLPPVEKAAYPDGHRDSIDSLYQEQLDQWGPLALIKQATEEDTEKLSESLKGWLFYFIVFGIKPNFFSVTIKLAWKR